MPFLPLGYLDGRSAIVTNLPARSGVIGVKCERELDLTGRVTPGEPPDIDRPPPDGLGLGAVVHSKRNYAMAIGLLLCETHNSALAQYALRDIAKPTANSPNTNCPKRRNFAKYL